MKRTTKPHNVRLTSSKDRRKQHIIKSVVKRRQNVSLRGLGRSLWRIAKVFILIAFLGGAYWAATEGYRRLFWENPDYWLKEVNFSTNGSLTKAEAIAAAGLEIKRNIFSYKLDTARDRLKAVPQVASVEIRRYLPSLIEIAITERKPTAWISAKVPTRFDIAEHSHMVDAHGVIFQPRRPAPEYRNLPVICGFHPDDIKPGNTIRTAEMESAVELIGLIRDSADLQAEIIDLSKGWCFVVTDRNKTRITFGLDDLPTQLWRLEEAKKATAGYGQTIDTINLMIARNVPLTFQPPTVPEADIDALLLGREPKSESGKSAPGAESSKASGKGSKSSAPAAKKSEPSRSKQTPKGENSGLLRPFRSA